MAAHGCGFTMLVVFTCCILGKKSEEVRETDLEGGICCCLGGRFRSYGRRNVEGAERCQAGGWGLLGF